MYWHQDGLDEGNGIIEEGFGVIVGVGEGVGLGVAEGEIDGLGEGVGVDEGDGVIDDVEPLAKSQVHQVLVAPFKYPQPILV